MLNAPVSRGPARRLSREERERLILRGAIQYFAECGFEGQTRELAKRLGVTQPLIFRYFSTKDDLVDRVYEEVYLSRWNPYWKTLLQDRQLPLRGRLISFYNDYTRAIFSPEWVRIFMYSGLRGLPINKRYMNLMQERIIWPLCA
ncbi:MAG: helix-turn-helix transcriptional regulator, partial [Alphaproteobacteria bacterium]|nr:helix-turn-helix transcriptional regulator [Alphaproteobacteria bacterium]